MMEIGIAVDEFTNKLGGSNHTVQCIMPSYWPEKLARILGNRAKDARCKEGIISGVVDDCFVSQSVIESALGWAQVLNLASSLLRARRSKPAGAVVCLVAMMSATGNEKHYRLDWLRLLARRHGWYQSFCWILPLTRWVVFCRNIEFTLGGELDLSSWRIWMLMANCYCQSFDGRESPMAVIVMS